MPIESITMERIIAVAPYENVRMAGTASVTPETKDAEAFDLRCYVECQAQKAQEFAIEKSEEAERLREAKRQVELEEAA